MNKQELLQFLQNNNLVFTLIQHQPIFSVEDGDKVNLPNRDKVVRNLFLRDAKKQNYYIITLNIHKKIDLKELAVKLKSSRLSFANPTSMESFLNVKPGSVTPFAILNDTSHQVKLYFDAALKNSLLGCHPLENNATIFMDFNILFHFLQSHHPYVYTLDL